jgi:hypothetical protein
MELELAVLLLLVILGSVFFGRFEGETSRARRLLKWGVFCGATLGLQTQVGHAALLLPLVLGVVGLSVHFWWCRVHGIHPLNATPRRRYYELRRWPWTE